MTDEFWIQTIRSAPSNWLVDRVESGREFLREAEILMPQILPEPFSLKQMVRIVESDVQLMSDELVRRKVRP
jgi:hypothetical protein